MHLPPNLRIRHRILELALISNEHHYDSVYIAPLSSRSPVLQHRHGVIYPSGNWFIMRKPGVQPIAIHNPITPRSGRREPRVSHSPRDVSAADSGEGCSTSVPRLTRVWDVSFLIGRSLRAGSKLLIGRPHESLSLDLRIGVSMLSLFAPVRTKSEARRALSAVQPRLTKLMPASPSRISRNLPVSRLLLDPQKQSRAAVQVTFSVF